MRAEQRREKDPTIIVDPVEINAGAWSLRALRADIRIDDRPALAEVTLDPTTGEIGTRARDGHSAAAVAAAESVRRFGAAIGVITG